MAEDPKELRTTLASHVLTTKTLSGNSDTVGFYVLMISGKGFESRASDSKRRESSTGTEANGKGNMRNLAFKS